jgi:hypothetical protein
MQRSESLRGILNIYLFLNFRSRAVSSRDTFLFSGRNEDERHTIPLRDYRSTFIFWESANKILLGVSNNSEKYRYFAKVNIIIKRWLRYVF